MIKFLLIKWLAPVTSNYVTSEYPVVHIANGLRVIYRKSCYSAFIGINKNWSGCIKTPIIDEIKGNLNVLVLTGTFWGKIFPFCIWHCGIVGEIIGGNDPFDVVGTKKLL